MTTTVTRATAPARAVAAAGACCTPSGAPAMDTAQALSLSRQFKAIADPNRLRLVSLISSSAGSEACVCDLTEPLDLGQPTVSHHLKVLVDAGILHREKRGIWAYYSLVPGALDALAAVLTTTTGER
ncbi:helix-turn-helix transcriptional regulator [Arthrobacter agilis]|uniref:ArsR/SmtB family transcription factor n=1 Tax=Arthrobacter agilis TaxID=37921 RepID=UPI000B350BFD|nr:metalloregulator ArsR/SmtB family transcription factor [Arthrobacter agilis]OUM43087.1 transcriptional regulator [Arthrobacter agilis]PPB46031.1 transcriptional regulator [Arthrobacter agilis]TPV25573.1 helix-turn-helix transcriptional regulator [Arthrobacter agilis]